jgi:hypothetical protein
MQVDLDSFSVQQVVFYIGVGISAGLGFIAGLWT